MLGIENNAMLIVINIGGILEHPRRIVDGNGDDSVVLASSCVKSSCISFIFLTKSALRIHNSGGLHVSRSRDCLRILFGLRKVYRIR